MKCEVCFVLLSFLKNNLSFPKEFVARKITSTLSFGLELKYCCVYLASSPYLAIKFMFHRVLWYLLKLFCLYLKVIFTCLYCYSEFISHLISCMYAILGKNDRNKVIYFSILFPRDLGSSELRLQLNSSIINICKINTPVLCLPKLFK